MYGEVREEEEEDENEGVEADEDVKLTANVRLQGTKIFKYCTYPAGRVTYNSDFVTCASCIFCA